MRLPLLVFWIFCFTCALGADTSDSLELEELQPGVYLVRDYLPTQDFGLVDCNGLVYVVGQEALVIDTPHSEALSARLVEKVREELGARVVGVVIGHTHADSMGGLAAFQKAGIPSYSSLVTQKLAAEQGLPIPAAGYENALDLKLGGKTVQCRYFGPGHTEDNAVTYLVNEGILFGDCLIKATGASKGYLGESAVEQWPQTVREVQAAFPEVKIVVPGHGKVGGPELLDYTVELFTP